LLLAATALWAVRKIELKIALLSVLLLEFKSSF
jgi:hypothetical protein